MGNPLFNNLKTAMLLSSLTALILTAGYAMGGAHGLVIALVIAGISNFVSYFHSDRIALASMSAYEVGP